MSNSAIMFAPELAAKLGVSQETIYELARVSAPALPFAITSASPRTLCVERGHLPLWEAAVKNGCCET
jgi:hypothetical protein